MAHTPTPWRATTAGSNMRENYSQSWAISRADGSTLIAGVFSDVAGGIAVTKSNARLIVRAVNALEPMREALKESPCYCVFKPVAGKAERECIPCKRCAALALADKEQA